MDLSLILGKFKMVLKKAIKKIMQNFNTSCEFCNKKLKRKDAYYEKVKMLQFAYPKVASFCNKKCCEKYKEYETSFPKKFSACSSCAIHPGLLEK